MKIFLEMLSNKLFLVTGVRFSNAFTKEFKLRDSEINTVLELRDKIKGGGGNREKLKVPLDLFPWKQQVTADSCKSLSHSLEPKVAECWRIHN